MFRGTLERNLCEKEIMKRHLCVPPPPFNYQTTEITDPKNGVSRSLMLGEGGGRLELWCQAEEELPSRGGASLQGMDHTQSSILSEHTADQARADTMMGQRRAGYHFQKILLKVSSLGFLSLPVSSRSLLGMGGRA